TPVTPAPLAKVTTNRDATFIGSIKEAIVFDNPQADAAVYGTIQLLAEFYTELAPVGGAITLQLASDIAASTTRGYTVPVDNTILLVHQDVGTFLAVQPRCPHAARPLADFPQLAMVGGVVCGQPMGLGNPIIVTRVDANTVIAVDSKCTHLGCTVEWNQQNSDFECPCHGSTFATDGRVKVGPATVPL